MHFSPKNRKNNKMRSRFLAETSFRFQTKVEKKHKNRSLGRGSVPKVSEISTVISYPAIFSHG